MSFGDDVCGGMTLERANGGGREEFNHGTHRTHRMRKGGRDLTARNARITMNGWGTVHELYDGVVLLERQV